LKNVKINIIINIIFILVINRPEKLSAADITAICQEAGILAVRKNRYVILAKDFEKAYRNTIKKRERDFNFYR
jgi:26S proteasome regulatory subunit T3